MLTLDGDPVDLSAAEVATLRMLLALPDRTLRALLDLAEQQVALEDGGMPPARVRPAPVLADDGSFLWPIACEVRIAVGPEPFEPPRCRWKPCLGKFDCQICGRSVSSTDARFAALTMAYDKARSGEIH